MIANGSLRLIVMALAVIFISTAIHELMHAYVALKLGDDLAHSHGRISLNPLKHIDPFLTVVLPLVLLLLGMQPILAAKPVPINTARLRGGDMGLAAVGIAGPLTNLALACVAALFLRFATFDSGLLLDFVVLAFKINIGLFVFNMLPLPPLDGSRLLYAFAPEPVQRVMQQIESFGIVGIILVISLLSPVLGPVLLNIQTALANILIG